MCSRTIWFTQYLCRTILFCHPFLVSVTLLVFLCLYQYSQYMSLNNIFIRDSAFILPFHWLLAMICYRTYAGWHHFYDILQLQLASSALRSQSQPLRSITNQWHALFCIVHESCQMALKLLSIWWTKNQY